MSANSTFNREAPLSRGRGAGLPAGQAGGEVFTASSPGRLDVMGGFADYSGSLVLQMPISNDTTVSIKLRNDFICRLISHLPDGKQETTFDYRILEHSNYQTAHQALTKDSKKSWIAYVIGCAFTLEQAKRIDFKGADFSIQSNIPLGKGVSSSAALEVATMKALAAAFGISFSRTELPTLAQRVENQIVGAPCGLMDQLTSYFGKSGYLLPITCQPDILHQPISIPNEIQFIGIDSGVRHAVSGSSYTDVRCAAFMGYSIIAKHLGLSAKDIIHARESGDRKSLPYQGYLSNISPEEFERSFKKILPEKIRGKDFISQNQNTIDPATRVKEDNDYAVFNCTAHPIYENARVVKFMEAIRSINKNGNDHKQLQTLGELIHESHTGYSNCGLGSERTDEIVEIAKEYSTHGIFGAKITGGGSGGAVCLLAVGDEGIQSAKKIHRMMEERYRTELSLFVTGSPV